MRLKEIDPLEMIDFNQWQHMMDLMCSLAQVKSAAITRLELPHIEIFQISKNPDNPLYEGLKVELADHYCEAVINQKDLVTVPSAPESDQWCHAPEIAHGLISYMGYPLFLPDGNIFGTICIHDNKKNIYSRDIQLLLKQFKTVVEAHFKIALQAAELKAALRNVKQLEGMLPICSHCKNIRNDQGYWQVVENYVAQHSGARFSHSICPECARKYYPEYALYDK